MLGSVLLLHGQTTAMVFSISQYPESESGVDRMNEYWPHCLKLKVAKTRAGVLSISFARLM